MDEVFVAGERVYVTYATPSGFKTRGLRILYFREKDNKRWAVCRTNRREEQVVETRFLNHYDPLFSPGQV